MNASHYWVTTFVLIASAFLGLVLGGGFGQDSPNSHLSASESQLTTAHPTPAATQGRNPTPVRAEPTTSPVVPAVRPPSSTTAATELAPPTAITPLVAVATAQPTSATASAQPTSGTNTSMGSPEFRLGFKELAARLGPSVGQPVEDEHYDPGSGSVLQRTTTGLMVWQEAGNRISFTDGVTTWALGPDGRVYARDNRLRFEWERDATTDPAIVIPRQFR